MKKDHLTDSRRELYRQAGRRNMIKAQRLAKKGKRHPDREVDELALRWALAALSSEPLRPETYSSASAFLKAFLIDAFSFGCVGHLDEALADRTDRKFARRIVEAHGHR